MSAKRELVNHPANVTLLDLNQPEEGELAAVAS
jgi:hypothetical protein